MKRKKVSIRDIASDLNISVTTVSFVLNGKAEEKHISKKLTQKILDHVKKVNYKPNQIAQSLRTGESKIMVFMVEDISNLFFARLARLIEDLAYKKGYKILFCSNDNKDKKSVELINLFKVRQVDGFILVSSPGIQTTIEQLMDENIPVVLLDRYFPTLNNTNYVVTDNSDATFKAIVHFIENGFKNIAYVTIDAVQSQMHDRLSGYQNAVKKNNLPNYTLEIPFNEAIKNNSEIYIEKFLKKYPDIDAILFATNYLTQAGLKVIKRQDDDLIDRIGIITFDDNELFETYSPAITAVAQPLKEMAEEAMELIIKLIKSKEKTLPSKQIVLKSSLVIRESSKKRN